MTFYIPHFFKLEEFVPRDIFQSLGGRAWVLMDARILAIMDRIRNRYDKPITINNWRDTGPFEFRGFRPPNCMVGAPFSQHRFGRAVDFDVQGMTAEEVRADIKANAQHMDFNPIMVVELGTNWVHIDIRNTKDPIHWINP